VFLITCFIQVISVFTAATVANASPIYITTMKSKLFEFASTVMPYSMAHYKTNWQSSAIGQDIAREVVGVVVANIQSNGAIIRSIRGAP